jgi:hypothetical protein
MITYVEDQVRVRSHVGGHRDVAIRQSMSGRQHGTCNDPLPCVCILRITGKMEFNKNSIKKVVNPDEHSPNSDLHFICCM